MSSKPSCRLENNTLMCFGVDNHGGCISTCVCVCDFTYTAVAVIDTLEDPSITCLFIL